jgi:hypothetical protein
MPITARDAALMVGLLKIAHTKMSPINPDDYVDSAGYAAFAAEMAGRDA